VSTLAHISSADAARLFLDAQGLWEDPSRKADAKALKAVVSRLGFVQMDTINVVARAHDLILRSRLQDYRPEQLQKLLEKDRFLFEGFTHDASAILAEYYPQWKPRFRRDEARMREHAWWQHHFRGTDAEQILSHVLERITEEGPLMSKDFEHPEKRGPWWGWKPQKAALDFLWRSGRLAIRGRKNFHKIYDLAERVHPAGHQAEEPAPEAHVAWACASAAERLVLFTPKELAEFWAAIDATDAKAWCEEEAKVGRLERVLLDTADGTKPQPAFALPDWEARLKRLGDPPAGIRLLAPFDPVLRDRARALRRFAFDYRFEAFVPEAKRSFGYFVLPLLEGERLVGRLDPKLHRDREVLEIKGLWWEPRIKATPARKKALQQAVARFAEWCGVRKIIGI
jgi:uncharacterized protein YcaQ